MRPELYARLMADLRGLTPDTLKWTKLEQRPILWALVHEGLRMIPGTTQRSARCARDEDLVYTSKDGSVRHVIPRGTPIGMSAIIQHWDEGIFPDPDTFNPDRWLLPDGTHNHGMLKHTLSFGRGHRGCLGDK